MLWAEGHVAEWTPRALAGCGRVCLPASPLPPSGFLLLLFPWEEVQLFGCRQEETSCPYPAGLGLPTHRERREEMGGATRTQPPTMAIDISEVSGENGLDLLTSAAYAVWFARFDPKKKRGGTNSFKATQELLIYFVKTLKLQQCIIPYNMNK